MGNKICIKKQESISRSVEESIEERYSSTDGKLNFSFEKSEGAISPTLVTGATNGSSPASSLGENIFIFKIYSKQSGEIKPGSFKYFKTGIRVKKFNENPFVGRIFKPVYEKDTMEKFKNVLMNGWWISEVDSNREIKILVSNGDSENSLYYSSGEYVADLIIS